MPAMRGWKPGMRVRESGERVMGARASDESMRGSEPLMRARDKMRPVVWFLKSLSERGLACL